MIPKTSKYDAKKSPKSMPKPSNNHPKSRLGRLLNASRRGVGNKLEKVFPGINQTKGFWVPAPSQSEVGSQRDASYVRSKRSWRRVVPSGSLRTHGVICVAGLHSSDGNMRHSSSMVEGRPEYLPGPFFHRLPDTILCQIIPGGAK